METKSEKSAKKFSFRKRRSSKGKKEDELQPVDLETEQQTTEAIQNCEETPEKPSGTVEQESQTPANTLEDSKAAESSGEDPGQKSTGEPAVESGGKKKSKRRSLFKRNSKKSSVDESCELRVKESENTEEKNTEQKDETGNFVETTVNNVMSSAEEEQVVCEGLGAEITEQSDGEGYLSVGEFSEAEGEGKGSSPESVTVEADKGTKRKSFFKRGLSLKRRKSKKQTNESKEDTVTTEQASKDKTETEADKTETEAPLESSEAAADINDQNKVEALTENSEGTEDINNESKTDSENTSSATDKKLPIKPARKVSFIGPDGTRLDSSDDGDSPTEQHVESGDESDGDTVTGENGPNEVLEEVSEIVVPEVVVMAENTECSEPLPEGDDDDLTEVSSMSSDLLASSDAPDTISTSDTSRLFTLTDTDDNGSRITLEEISEESEAESKLEIVENVPESKEESNPDVAGEEIGTESTPEVASEGTGTESKPAIVGSGFESRPESSEKDVNEATKLLGNADKVGEWEMVNKSNDMSVELSRVRKQTLFSVKRLCCSVM